MRAIVQNWRCTLLAVVILAVVGWIAATQVWADQAGTLAPPVVAQEKPAEKTVKPSAKEAKELEQRKAELKAQKEAMKKLVAAAQEQQRKDEEARKNDPAWRPSHEETAVIKINEGTKDSTTLHSFCLNADGNILAACGGEPIVSLRVKKLEEMKPTDFQPSEIRVFSPEGKRLKTWPMAFKPEAICVADDGMIFVAGAGHIAKLDQTGKVLQTADSPQMSDLPPLPPIPEKKEPTKEEKAAEEARQKKIKELQAEANKSLAKYAKAQQEFQKAETDALGIKTKGLTPVQIMQAKLERMPKLTEQERALVAKLQEKILKGPMDAFVAAQQKVREASTTPEMLAMQMRAERPYKSGVAGIAVSKNDVFVACPMAKTYGFAVWRVDRDFANAKGIIEGLAGCCGQMDIQAKDGEVWVAHNSRHKVERHDRDGKMLLSFGKTDRQTADGFGGCCEPKNLRFGPKGELYASESGPPVAIKRFSPEGKFLGVVGLPTFESGCVRVTIEVSPDGGKVYILDTGGNAIHVLTEKKAEPSK